MTLFAGVPDEGFSFLCPHPAVPMWVRVGEHLDHIIRPLISESALPLPSLTMMMMIAFITFNSSLVPFIEGLCSSDPWQFEFSGFGRNRPDDLGIKTCGDHVEQDRTLTEEQCLAPPSELFEELCKFEDRHPK